MAFEVSLLQAITLAIACIGAVLGVINTWRAIDSDRVKLLVIPKLAAGMDGSIRLVIDVINQSSFAVTVTHIGFDLSGTSQHIQFIPDARLGNTLPERLEARTALTFFYPAGTGPVKHFAIIKSAYVLTACGIKRKGVNSALRKFVSNTASAWGE